jgi:glycerol-3-phosphate acyltransferase PlsY
MARRTGVDSNLRVAAAVAAGWLAGSVPFSNIAARRKTGVDLRSVGSGTVSGTGLYEVAGFGPLAVAGALDVAKGAVGPLLAPKQRPGAVALAAGATVAGHDWSPFLDGAGGRGISPAIGALLATAPTGAVVLLGGLAVGRVVHATGLASFVADVALIPVAATAHGRRGALVAAAVLVPIIAKRLAGNSPPVGGWRIEVLRNRLLFDRDEWSQPRAIR